MANWCYTSYVIDGKRKEVQSLFSKMNNLEKRRKPLEGSDFGKTWLGNLVIKIKCTAFRQHTCSNLLDTLYYLNFVHLTLIVSCCKDRNYIVKFQIFWYFLCKNTIKQAPHHCGTCSKKMLGRDPCNSWSS